MFAELRKRLPGQERVRSLLSRLNDVRGFIPVVGQPHRVFADVSDEEWLQIMIGSVAGSRARGVRLPGFPPDELQRTFVGSAGEQAIREGFAFYRIVNDYAAQLNRPLRASSRVLDFGCGWGRILRLFLKDVKSKNLCGIDVDP